ncbi:MAG: tyrosine-type recombinase/integrase [Omnitrophica WOR_2 bacterium]
METELRSFLSSLQARPSYSLNTLQAYKRDIQRFLIHLQKKLDRPPTPGDWTDQQVEAFFETERQEGKRLSTVLRRRAALRRFYQYLIHQGYIPASAMQFGKSTTGWMRAGETPKKQPELLTEEHLNRLWQVFGQSQRPLARRDQAILSVLLETGISVSTLISLDLPDLDLRAGKLHIYHESMEDCWLPLGNAGKTVETYLREGRPELNPSEDEPAIFISQTGARMSRQSVWQVMRHWGEAANLPVTVSPRVVRHTATLRMARMGHSMNEIQILLGHTNPLSTQALLHRLENLSEEKQGQIESH